MNYNKQLNLQDREL